MNDLETTLAKCANNIDAQIENLNNRFSILQKDLNGSESKVIGDIIDKSKIILKDIYQKNTQKKIMISNKLKQDVIKLVRNYEIACILGKVESLEKRTRTIYEHYCS